MIDKPNGWYTGIVNIHDLASCENVYVLPTRKFRRELKTFIEKCNISLLTNRLAEKEKSRRICIYKKLLKIRDNPNIKISLSFLENLISFMKYDNSINDKIVVLATQHGAWEKFRNSLINPKLPFNFTSQEGVRLIASILCDGGINSTLNPHFTSKSIELKKNFFRNMEAVLGKVRDKSSELHNECLILPKIVGIILVYGLGLKYGRKVLTNPGIPEFIFNLSNHNKWAFLSQVIDEDGSVDLSTNRLQVVHAIEVVKPKEVPRLLQDTKKLFESLNIKVFGPTFNSAYFVKGKRRERWMIRVGQKKDLQKCYRNLDLKLNYKKTMLKTIARV